ncbi:hypothetical protein Tco_1528676 [Tanacetum coccineum]
MLLNVDQLQKQLDKDDFQEDGSMFWVINRQFQNFIDSKFTLDYDSQMSNKYFVEYTGIEVKHFGDTLLQHMGNVKKSVAERTRRQRQYDRRVNKRHMQTQESKVDAGKYWMLIWLTQKALGQTQQCKMKTTGQQHTEQPEIINEGQHGQILNETSNKAKIEKEIDVLETMNTELELLGFTDLMRQKNKRMKQEGLI